MNEHAYHQQSTQLLTANGEDLAGYIMVAVIMVVTILSALTAVLSFMFTVTLFRVPEEHRKMKLGAPWLIMVPVLGIPWMYVVVRQLAQSFRSYFQAREIDGIVPPKGDFGHNAGLFMCIGAAAAQLAGLLVYTKNTMIIALGVGFCTLVAMVLTGLYFWQVLRIRSRIPDPQSAIPEDYL